MAGITITQAETNLSEWLKASEAVAKNQSYSIAGRSYSRADARTIMEMIKFWDGMVKKLDRGGVSVRGITPLE